MKHTALIIMTLALVSSCSTRQQQQKSQPDPEPREMTIIESSGDSEDIVYQFLEEPATFAGGEKALQEYLEKNLEYPEEALRLGLEGTVYLQFIVEKDGSLTDIKVMHSRAHPSMEQAAIDVLMGMPAWNPGRQRGREVRSVFILPVKFVL